MGRAIERRESEMENEITIQSLAERLAALEVAVASLAAKKVPEADGIDFSSVGGRKVGHHLTEKQGAPIDLSPAYGATGKRVR